MPKNTYKQLNSEPKNDPDLNKETQVKYSLD